MLDKHIFNTLPPELRPAAEQGIGMTEREAYAALCGQFTPQYNMADILPSQLDLGLFSDYPVEFCGKMNFLPVSRHDIFLTCASFTPWDAQRLSAIRAQKYESIRMLCITRSLFIHLLEYVKTAVSLAQPAYQTPEGAEEQISFEVPTGLQTFKSLLKSACEKKASDIHIEQQKDRVAVKFRINGELVVQEPVDRFRMREFISAVKNYASIPLNATKNLADCRFSYLSYDFRVAKLPVSGGRENFVLRILDSKSVIKNSGKLPFSGKGLALFRSCLSAESGMIILTGPTGSGKTTTLYSALTNLDLAGRNVRTIEDPIEYMLPKAVQTQIDPINGVTFANTLRSMLRADPDVIMVGEIRDAETAELAAAASNTGHLVLTTLHTRSAAGVIPRLQDLGLSRGEIQEAVTLAVSQRLLPLLCPSCKTFFKPDKGQIALFESEGIAQPEFLCGRLGCPKCSNTGIIGRRPVFEFLHFSGAIKELVAGGVPIGAIEKESFKEFPSLFRSALSAAADGETPIEAAYKFLVKQ